MVFCLGLFSLSFCCIQLYLETSSFSSLFKLGMLWFNLTLGTIWSFPLFNIHCNTSPNTKKINLIRYAKSLDHVAALVRSHMNGLIDPSKKQQNKQQKQSPGLKKITAVRYNCRFSCDVINFQNKKLPILVKF